MLTQYAVNWTNCQFDLFEQGYEKFTFLHPPRRERDNEQRKITIQLSAAQIIEQQSFDNRITLSFLSVCILFIQLMGDMRQATGHQISNRVKTHKWIYNSIMEFKQLFWHFHRLEILIELCNHNGDMLSTYQSKSTNKSISINFRLRPRVIYTEPYFPFAELAWHFHLSKSPFLLLPSVNERERERENECVFAFIYSFVADSALFFLSHL